MENTETQVIEVEMNAMDDSSNSGYNRTKKGFALTGFGAAILLAGCISTMIVPSTHEIYNAILYLPTTLGSIMVIYGFYCVFEK